MELLDGPYRELDIRSVIKPIAQASHTLLEG